MSQRFAAPYSDDPEAIDTREKCDYSIKITREMAEKGTAPRQIRVFADGIYDLFHQGHARQLMQAKNAFDHVYLIVGVCSDRMTHSNKGKTVMSENERYEAVRHCRYVDEVVKESPWSADEEFITKHKIDFVAHDDEPYTSPDHEDVYAFVKSRGMFVATKRTEGVSTSDLVARIVKDYDVYVRRNLARGYSAKEMNVSFVNEKKFLLQNKLDEIKDKVKEKQSNLITKWENKSTSFIHNFLQLFGPDSTLNRMWTQSTGTLKRALSPPPSLNTSPSGSRMNLASTSSSGQCRRKVLRGSMSEGQLYKAGSNGNGGNSYGHRSSRQEEGHRSSRQEEGHRSSRQEGHRSSRQEEDGHKSSGQEEDEEFLSVSDEFSDNSVSEEDIKAGFTFGSVSRSTSGKLRSGRFDPTSTTNGTSATVSSASN